MKHCNSTNWLSHDYCNPTTCGACNLQYMANKTKTKNMNTDYLY